MVDWHYYCVLLGSGASADTGLRTSKQLLESFLMTCPPSSRKIISQTIKRVNAVQNMNIEDLALALRDDHPAVYAELGL